MVLVEELVRPQLFITAEAFTVVVLVRTEEQVVLDGLRCERREFDEVIYRPATRHPRERREPPVSFADVKRQFPLLDAVDVPRRTTARKRKIKVLGCSLEQVAL